jgi:amino acid transporter
MYHSIYTVGSLTDPATLAPTPNTGYLIINMFYNATNSLAATNFMTSVIIINYTAGCIAALAAASRQFWAFARNGGVPFSNVFAPVRVLFYFLPYIGIVWGRVGSGRGQRPGLQSACGLASSVSNPNPTCAEPGQVE